VRDHVSGHALGMGARLPLEIVEHSASLRLTDMGNGGANALDRSNNAVRGDPFLLVCPRRLSVSHGPTVRVAAALSDSLREDGKAAFDKLTRAHFGRRVLADGGQGVVDGLCKPQQ
jgi:hypothetical protein